MGIAPTAPAYSLAATLGFVVATVGPQTLLLVPLAFIPMFFSAWANKEMNRADPDCGSSFTWAARALGPRTGWYAGGWGTIASDLLAMASQSQIAGQYFFLLIGANSIGVNATSPWVLTVGIAWIVILTYICYRGIQVSARLQVTLLAVEIFMLLLLAVVAIVRVGLGHAPTGHAAFSWSWLNPAHFASPSVFMTGMLLSMFHKALPAIFGRVHPRYLAPWFSTLVFSVASAVMYVALNFVSGGNVLADSVTAATFFVALYLGSTGFACDDRRRAVDRRHHRARRPGLDAVPAPIAAGVLLRRVDTRRLLDHRR
jgi:amino acid transporter